MVELDDFGKFLLRQRIGQSSLITNSVDVNANLVSEQVHTPDEPSDLDVYFSIAAEETLGNTGAVVSVSCDEIAMDYDDFPVHVWSVGIPVFAEISHKNPFRLRVRAGASNVSVTYSMLAIRVKKDAIRQYRRLKAVYDSRFYAPPVAAPEPSFPPQPPEPETPPPEPFEESVVPSVAPGAPE